MSQQPRWEVKNEGSFASVLVALPSASKIHCESDAVITMAEGVDVRGVLSGGILAGLARAFLTSESFFTARVENTASQPGDVLVAPSDPGGIALHRLFPGEEMFLTSGSYLAADESVRVESALQAQFGNSLLSGTGFFLLRASGQGNLAISAFGSMHKYILSSGEKRSVDNGHIVCWTASMNYKMKFASARAGLFGSMTSGEGLHCEFEGPGVVYIQSHKPSGPIGVEGSRRRRGNSGSGGGPFGTIIGLFIVVMTTFIMLAVVVAILYGNIDFDVNSGGGAPSRSPTRHRKYNAYGYGQQQQQQGGHYRVANGDGGGGGAQEL